MGGPAQEKPGNRLSTTRRCKKTKSSYPPSPQKTSLPPTLSTMLPQTESSQRSLILVGATKIHQGNINKHNTYVNTGIGSGTMSEIHKKKRNEINNNFNTNNIHAIDSTTMFPTSTTTSDDVDNTRIMQTTKRTKLVHQTLMRRFIRASSFNNRKNPPTEENTTISCDASVYTFNKDASETLFEEPPSTNPFEGSLTSSTPIPARPASRFQKGIKKVLGLLRSIPGSHPTQPPKSRGPHCWPYRIYRPQQLFPRGLTSQASTHTMNLQIQPTILQ